MALSVPWFFGAAGANTPTTQLDQDFAAVADYINARNPTIGPLTSRPGPGNAGAIWIASDESNQVYVDDGIAWVPVHSGAPPGGEGEMPAGTRMLFEQDSAPIGWTRDISSVLNDRLIRIVTAERTHGGSWTISGFSAANHTHAGVDHLHGVAAVNVSGSSSNFNLNDESAGTEIGMATNVHVHTVPAHSTGGADRALTTGAATAGVNNDGTWRPLHRDVIVATKN